LISFTRLRYLIPVEMDHKVDYTIWCRWTIRWITPYDVGGLHHMSVDHKVDYTIRCRWTIRWTTPYDVGGLHHMMSACDRGIPVE
jgi:hypothetical protein